MFHLLLILLACPGPVDDIDGHDREEHQHATHQGGQHCLYLPGVGDAKKKCAIIEKNMTFNLQERRRGLMEAVKNKIKIKYTRLAGWGPGG